MSKTNLENMTVDQLVNEFTEIALKQDDALLDGNVSQYTRLFHRMTELRNELKSRPGDQRGALLSLFDHQNAQVRIKAALTTLAVLPDESREVLEILIENREFPQAADAKGMLRALDEGTYIPS